MSKTPRSSQFRGSEFAEVGFVGIGGLGLRLGTILFMLSLASAPAAVLKIELPRETASFKPGSGSDLANGQCLTCHSVEYVMMQPPEPQRFWEAEVKKMQEKYGAQIPQEQVATIVSYLTRNYGAQPHSTAPVAVPAPAPQPVLNTESLDGQALATKYGCLGCHTVNAKLVGPAYKDVAAKYEHDPDKFGKIAQQIHQGGSGKWGSVLMPPFPAMSEPETRALADWILSQK